MKRKISLLFEGTLQVEVDYDGEPEGEGWDEAVGKAWANIPPEEISEAADLTETILED